MKRLAAKGPPDPTKVKKDGDVLTDIWASGPSTSKNIQKFKDFSAKSRINVKSVILPMGGQSFNPSADDHKNTLKKVLNEEEKEIEKDYKDSMQYRLHEANRLIQSKKQDD